MGYFSRSLLGEATQTQPFLGPPGVRARWGGRMQALLNGRLNPRATRLELCILPPAPLPLARRRIPLLPFYSLTHTARQSQRTPLTFLFTHTQDTPHGIPHSHGSGVLCLQNGLIVHSSRLAGVLFRCASMRPPGLSPHH
jgi:hypothetical protein